MLKIIALLVLLLFSVNASAEQVVTQSDTPSVNDARALIEQGRDNDAIGVLGQLVENSPANFQAWFMLGVTQAKQRRFHDAVISFGKVVSLQPKLAEPHNNLAVIYNELGDFRAAVKELEASLKLKPDYATAHENIGDLYVKLAADAYRKALGTDFRPALRQRYERLLHIRDAHKTDKPKIAVDQQATPTAKAEIVQPPAVAQGRLQPETASASEAKTSEASEHQTKPAPLVIKPVIKPATPSPVPALHVARQDNAPKQALPADVVKSSSSQDSIKTAMAAVEAWRSAWNRQDVPAYFAAYSETFDFSPRFETLEQWKHYKQVVIKKRAFIRVTLENIEAKHTPAGEIRLVFLQHFRSDSFNSDDIKEMLLRQTQDGWKIIHETSQ